MYVFVFVGRKGLTTVDFVGGMQGSAVAVAIAITIAVGVYFDCCSGFRVT